MRAWFSLFLLAVFPVGACACECFPIEHACQAYSKTPIIFAGTVIGLDSKETTSSRGSYTQRIHFEINESFKNASTSTLTVLNVHVQSSCPSKAPEFVLNHQYLVWAFLDEQGNVLLTDCTATRPLEDGAELISELRELRSGRGATYIFGGIYRNRIFPNGVRWGDLENYSSVPLPDTRIVVSSAGHKYVAYADQQGRFSIPLDGAGTYHLAVDLPEVFEQQPLKQGITLDDHSCADLSVWTQYQFLFRGRVVDSNGTPVEGVPLSLLSSDKFESFNYTFTNKVGEYELVASEPGEYLVGVNWDENPSKEAPFPTMLYPGVPDLEHARPLHTEESGPVLLSDLRLPSSSKCTLRVRVANLDGKGEKEAQILTKYFPEQFWHPAAHVDAAGEAEISIVGPSPVLVVASRGISVAQELRSPLQIIDSCPAKPLVLRLTETIPID